MDFWDVAKLMWRMWFITVPLLLLTATGGALVARSVGPQYQATSHMAVLAPTVRRDAPANGVTYVNPWTEEALADAAIVRLEGKKTHDQLTAAGYVGEWTIDVDGRLPVITIEVVAPTTQQAQATMDKVVTIIEQEIHDRQAGRQVRPDEFFTTVRYEDGDNVEEVTSRRTRAMAAEGAAGLILTMGLVIGVDAIRRKRRAARAAAATPTASDRVAGVALAAHGPNLPPRPPRAPQPPGSQPSRAPHADEPTARPESDPTVVLPLSNVTWSPTTRPDDSDAERDMTTEIWTR